MDRMILASVLELWNSAWPAALMMSLLGLGFAVALLIASIKLQVTVDPKIEQIHAALPKVDCGSCGFPGCGQYAAAVAADPELLGRCAPGGPKTAEKIAAILNLQISGGGAPLRPIVHCRAHTDDREYFATYEGIPRCTAANALPLVQACKFGCLGFGDCTRACKFGALHVIDGLATVDYDQCTGCGACAKTCPRSLIRLAPFAHPQMMTVGCSSRENGKSTRAACAVGCIGCGLCVKQTPLFTVENNLAAMNYTAYAPGPACETAMQKCPTGVIVLRGSGAPDPRPAKKTAEAAV
jgi:electron transport complex protein RnfB